MIDAACCLWACHNEPFVCFVVTCTVAGRRLRARRGPRIRVRARRGSPASRRIQSCARLSGTAVSRRACARTGQPRQCACILERQRSDSTSDMLTEAQEEGLRALGVELKCSVWCVRAHSCLLRACVVLWRQRAALTAWPAGRRAGAQPGSPAHAREQVELQPLLLRVRAPSRVAARSVVPSSLTTLLARVHSPLTCSECITAALKGSSKCPMCKQKTGRRGAQRRASRLPPARALALTPFERPPPVARARRV